MPEDCEGKALENNQSDMKTQGLACGPVGDSIFTYPFFGWSEENELPELFKRTAGLNDHRLLALVSVLIVENRLDKILAVVCPRYNCLTELNEFTFSFKIRMLEALALIPKSITEAAHI